MKRIWIFLLAISFSVCALAQYDDIYDSGSYNKSTKKTTTSTSSSSRSIDEYNRVGQKTEAKSSEELDLGEDYQYTKEIARFYDPEVVNIENVENVYIYNYDEEEKANSSANIYVNLGYTHWYSPWYYDSWFTWNPWGSVWYDPWYDPFWYHPYSLYPGYGLYGCTQNGSYHGSYQMLPQEFHVNHES